ncbi:hypothetical protein B0J11DRAFT_261626 [Dendryphion nanum]|uniref:Uncharacterized protein n=1 Tax=Dendryphion nanum TaxID=256645 RepID=A0A9P9E529_9PLEO|nr:hypothetical protein B0J11DRAFT_261626 [Dendryphion nanum]
MAHSSSPVPQPTATTFIVWTRAAALEGRERKRLEAEQILSATISNTHKAHDHALPPQDLCHQLCHNLFRLPRELRDEVYSYFVDKDLESNVEKLLKYELGTRAFQISDAARPIWDPPHYITAAYVGEDVAAEILHAIYRKHFFDSELWIDAEGVLGQFMKADLFNIQLTPDAFIRKLRLSWQSENLDRGLLEALRELGKLHQTANSTVLVQIPCRTRLNLLIAMIHRVRDDVRRFTQICARIEVRWTFENGFVDLTKILLQEECAEDLWEVISAEKKEKGLEGACWAPCTLELEVKSD